MTDVTTEPDVQSVHAWARRLVVARGDAFLAHGEDGLLVEQLHVPGLRPTVARENTDDAMLGSFYRVVMSIQLAVYPEDDFAYPFWDEPGRTWETVMQRFDENVRLEIAPPTPVTVPTLARVVTRCGWVPELSRHDIDVVTYTLFDIQPALAHA